MFRALNSDGGLNGDPYALDALISSLTGAKSQDDDWEEGDNVSVYISTA